MEQLKNVRYNPLANRAYIDISLFKVNGASVALVTSHFKKNNNFVYLFTGPELQGKANAFRARLRHISGLEMHNVSNARKIKSYMQEQYGMSLACVGRVKREHWSDTLTAIQADQKELERNPKLLQQKPPEQSCFFESNDQASDSNAADKTTPMLGLVAYSLERSPTEVQHYLKTAGISLGSYLNRKMSPEIEERLLIAIQSAAMGGMRKGEVDDKEITGCIEQVALRYRKKEPDVWNLVEVLAHGAKEDLGLPKTNLLRLKIAQSFINPANGPGHA